MELAPKAKCLCNSNCTRNLGKAPVKHGSMYAYSRTKGHSCRCQECLTYIRNLRSSRYWTAAEKSGRVPIPSEARGTRPCNCHDDCEKRQLKNSKNTPQHGDRLFTLHGCRCKVCTDSQKPCGCNPKCTVIRPLKKVIHGTRHCYQNHSCRCELCTKGNRVAAAEARKIRQLKLKSSSSEDFNLVASHGKYSTYVNWACRCEPCTAAHSKRCAEYARKRTEQNLLELESQVL